MLRGHVNFLGNTIPTWLVVAGLLAAAAGAAVGVVLTGDVTGQITTTVNQGLQIDVVSGGGFNGVSDDNTNFTSAKEISTGDKYDIQLELKNLSLDQMAVKLNLDIPPGITVHITNPRTSMTQSFDVTGISATTLTLTTIPVVDRDGDGLVTTADFDCTALGTRTGCTKNSVVDAIAGTVSVTLSGADNAGNDVTIGYSTGSNASQLVRTGIQTWLFKMAKDPGDAGKDLTVTIAHSDDSPPGFYTVKGDLRQASLKR